MLQYGLFMAIQPSSSVIVLAPCSTTSRLQCKLSACRIIYLGERQTVFARSVISILLHSFTDYSGRARVSIMDFGAPVVVHSIRSKSDVKTTPIVGANWTNTRGQILITEPYSVRLCHRDHGNILRAWTFRPDAMEAFVGVGAKMITEGRVRWIVARRKNGKVVAWREDDETGTLNMSKFSDVPTNGEASNNGSICNSKEIVISVSPERSVRLLVDSSNSISCTGWDTVFDVPLRTLYLPQQNASISKFADKILSSSISNDKKSLLVVLKTAVYVIGLTLHPPL